MGKTYMTSQINPSPTIVEKAGADIEDVRGVLLKYDTNGDVVVASTAGELVIGSGIITNNENVKTGQDVDIQIKDIGPVKVGATITKGTELMAGADGKAVAATAGKFVIGIALENAVDGQLTFMQFAKYYKSAT